VAFVAVMSFCALLIIITLIFDKFERMYNNNVSVIHVMSYFMYELPFQLKQLAPIVCPLAVLFSIGGLARGNETLSMMTTGINPLKIALPIFFAGFIISAGVFWAGETVIPKWKKQSMYVDKRYFHNKSEEDLQTDEDIFARGHDGRVYVMPLYNVVKHEMIHPNIQFNKTDYSGGVKRILADSASQISHDEQKSVWRFYNAGVWEYFDTGALKSYESFPTLDLELEHNLDDILTQDKDPDEMNFIELRSYIELMRERGQSADNYLTDLYQKIMFPLGVLLTMAIAFSFAIRARSGSVIGSFGPAIAWSLGYFALHAVFRAFGQAGVLNPYVAAMGANVVYLIAAGYYFRKSYRWYN